MGNFPILSTLIFLPIIAALFIAFFIKGGKEKSNKTLYLVSISFAVIEFILSLLLLFAFDKNNPKFQFVEKFSIDIAGFLANSNAPLSYSSSFFGIDGLSLTMILLTTFLLPICLLVSVNSIKNRVKEYVICFLLLESFVIGSFATTDIVLFYIFFEAILIPMFLIIGIWGGKEKNYAAYKFFLYTLFGSVLFLTGLIYIISSFKGTDISYLQNALAQTPLDIQKWLFLAFFVSFAVKIPMFPFHTWLPDAHVQAPTAGSVILAGVLIKLGAYGFLRFSLPFFPQASAYFAEAIFILSVIAIIYTSIVALMQEDIKKMIAYSSVAHMGFITMGIFSFTVQGIQGAIFQMISHGLVSSALFLCVGVVYDRMHTRQIADFGGLANKMPKYAFFFMIFMMASVGLPGTSGFVGEFLTIVGTFKANHMIAIFAAIGVILGACYMLWLYARVLFGEVKNPQIESIKDVNISEFISLSLMVILILALGIYPSLVLRFLDSPISGIINFK